MVEATPRALVRSELTSPGIRRRRCGRGFRYFGPDGAPLTETEPLARIRALVIPPAWEDVWICPHPAVTIASALADLGRAGASVTLPPKEPQSGWTMAW